LIQASIVHSKQPMLQGWHFPVVPRKKPTKHDVGVDMSLHTPSFNSY